VENLFGVEAKPFSNQIQRVETVWQRPQRFRVASARGRQRGPTSSSSVRGGGGAVYGGEQLNLVPTADLLEPEKLFVVRCDIDPYPHAKSASLSS
jgi:hypothetical protein